MSECDFCMEDSILDIFQIKKKRRVEAIKNILSKHKQVDLNIFVAKVSVCNGIDRLTVRKYIDELEAAGYIEIQNGKIVWKQDTQS
ncbi:MAG: hypothetical protein QXS74_09650 [Nitrososphaeria archaeon]